MIKAKAFIHSYLGDASVERQLETFINEQEISRDQIIRIFSTITNSNTEKMCLLYEEMPKG